MDKNVNGNISVYRTYIIIMYQNWINLHNFHKFAHHNALYLYQIAISCRIMDNEGQKLKNYREL